MDGVLGFFSRTILNFLSLVYFLFGISELRECKVVCIFVVVVLEVLHSLFPQKHVGPMLCL